MYKRCSNCGYEWPIREDFLGDPDITLIGYQVNFTRVEAGIILFNHTCKGTLAIHANDFKDLYDGPIFTQRAAGTDQCPDHCQHQRNLQACPVECECAYVRNILQIIRNWPKHRKIQSFKD
jgi:hypothetical protein